MPNHITNVLEIADQGGLSLEDICSHFLNEARHVDFNVITPAPECLKGFEPSCGDVDRARMALGLFEEPSKTAAPDLSEMTRRLALSNAVRAMCRPADKDNIANIIRAINAYAECGYLYWYDWNRDNWGTKWNAYDQPDDGHPSDGREFRFQTAWAHPSDLIIKLSERLPSVTFAVQFADEDTGSNCGTYTIRAGEYLAQDIAPRWDDQTKEQRRRYTAFAFTLTNPDADPRDYDYDENWDRIDEDEDGDPSPALSQGGDA